MSTSKLAKKVLLVLLLSFLLTLVNTSPVPRPEEQPQDPPGDGLTWELIGDTPGEIICTTDRSSDYYGLGVRLGIYMAWVSGWVANICVPDEIASSLDTNAIFLFALVVAMVRCTITDLVSQLDALMLMHLSGGTVFSVISIWGYRTCFYRDQGPRGISNFGGFGTHLRLFLSMTVSGYGLWFWYFGMNGSLLTGTGECAVTYTFFFSKLRADGAIRIWYIFVCVACTIYFGVMTLVSIIGPISRIMKMKWMAKYKYFRYSSRLKYATGFTYGQLKLIFYFLRIGNGLWIIFSIILCEFTLNYNNVRNVLGANGRIFFPSQLIPLTIGACGIIRVFYLRFDQWRNPVDSKPSLSDTPTIPTRTSTIPKGKNLLKIFAPATKPETGMEAEQQKDAKFIFEDSDVDPELANSSPLWRYLVAWLPWLQAATQWWRDLNENPSRSESLETGPLEQAHKLNVRSEFEDEENQRRMTWNTDDTATA